MMGIQTSRSASFYSFVAFLAVVVTSTLCSGCYRHQERVSRDFKLYSAGESPKSPRRDIVFVHGLDGGGMTTWQNGGYDGTYWPTWLQKENPDAAVWAVHYDASPSNWTGSAMPLHDRAENMIEQLRLKGIGSRPVVFVGHSMGGLIIKQMLNSAITKEHSDWKPLAENTKGVVFLATPHHGASAADLAAYVKYFKPSAAIADLKSNAAQLRSLNVWYRETVVKREIKNLVFFENHPVIGNDLVVDEGSSDPGIPGVIPIRVDADHISISKPHDKDSLVYARTAEFIKKTLAPVAEPLGMSFTEFITEFANVRDDPLRLKAFKENCVGRKVFWDAFVLNQIAETKDVGPAYLIGHELKPKFRDKVLARFHKDDFDESLSVGTPVAIEGILNATTDPNGATLRNCKVTRRQE